MFYLYFGVGVFAVPLIGSIRSLIPWTWRNRWGQTALFTYLIFTMGIMIEIHNRLHYWAPVTALNYFFVVQGMRLWRARDRRVGRFVIFLVPTLALILLAIFSYRLSASANSLSPHLQRARLMDQLNHTKDRHVILVKYGPRHSYLNEWVFNEADIDGSTVVWARAMNLKKDCELVRYFKDREIWSLEIDQDEAPIQLRPFPKRQCE